MSRKMQLLVLGEGFRVLKVAVTHAALEGERVGRHVSLQVH